MPRRDPDQKTKQDILETAMRLFAEKGLENVKVEDVVKEVGVTRGAFYHYFKSREELIAGVMYKAFEENDDNPYLLAYKQKGLNALEKLRFAAKLSLRSHLDASESMRKQIKELSSDPIVFKNEIIFQVTVMAAYIEKLLIEGNKDGSMHVSFPKQASQTIAWLVASWLSPYLLEVSYEEYIDKISFFEQLVASLGVLIMDDEMKEIYFALGRKEFKKE
ncbi:AcrR family transcriptional regulator [Lachnospiraceae bacterium]|nr:AcrR family transcriptional regulator [Lachnospiraceae bacterium]BDF39304.1 AcrR family transcriptional regulator [Lachnospiraceae bacterium]